ncbi:MAG TPA: threonine/serine exporter family protein [Propionibacteriaceae bacterium]|nr:threonine/serine exporter family protein [Propionibacteriaceae bacterium]
MLESNDAATQARQALELALRVGDVLLTAGMSANDVVVDMLRITEAYGLKRVHVDVTFTSIAVTYYAAPTTVPMTLVRTVQPDVLDFTKVRRVQALAEGIRAGLPLNDAISDLERIRDAPRLYSGWVASAGNAAIAPGVTLLFTLSWQILVITFLTGFAVDRLLLWASARRLPPFFSQLAAAAFITLVATGVSALGSSGVGLLRVDPTLIVVGGIILLVAGMTAVGAMQDAIDLFYVTASARFLEVAMMTGGIVLGIVAGLQVGVALGHPIAVSTQPLPLGPVVAQFIGATVISAAFALSAYAGLITVVLSGVMGALAWSGYLGMVTLGFGEVTANAAGALLAGFVATIIARRFRTPNFALIAAAVLPLVPGLSLFTGLLQAVGTEGQPGDLAASGVTLLQALGVAVGIAAGATLGTYLGRPVKEQLRRIRNLPRPRLRSIPTESQKTGE